MSLVLVSGIVSDPTVHNETSPWAALYLNTDHVVAIKGTGPEQVGGAVDATTGRAQTAVIPGTEFVEVMLSDGRTIRLENVVAADLVAALNLPPP